MTFSQLRTQVDALCRKYATELEVYRLRLLAFDFCDEMAVTMPKTKVPDKNPARSLLLLEWARILLKRMIDRGFRVKNFLDFHNYLECCLDRRVFPQASEVLRNLLPKAAERGLIPHSDQPVPF